MKAVYINSFIHNFLQWSLPSLNLPSLNLDMSIIANRDISKKSRTDANSVEPSHLDLLCLLKYWYMFWSTTLKEFINCMIFCDKIIKCTKIELFRFAFLSRDRTSVGHGDDGLDAITSNQRINTTLCKIKTSMYLKSSKKTKKL